MTRQAKIGMLAILLLLLGYVAYRSLWPVDAAPPVSGVTRTPWRRRGPARLTRTGDAALPPPG